jgi:glycosyltransferase involved in cell wall biosynthesis
MITTRLQLSCFIITYNEASRIVKTIESVKDLVDDLVVVDSGSTDGTQDLVIRSGARLISNSWPGYGPQKRFAEEQCRNDWVLNIDADEVMTANLAREIFQLFETGPPQLPAYRIYIKDVLPGDREPRLFARTFNVVRLYNRRIMRYSDSKTHDRVVSQGHEVGQLSGLFYHFTMMNFDQMILKLNSYSNLQAETQSEKPRAVLLVRLLFEMPIAFFHAYIFRGLIFGGWRGFVISVTTSFFRFMRIAKKMERQTRKK